MTLVTFLLPWTLLMQVQLQLCQDGVCQPHAKLQEKSRVVQTVETEAECLTLQLQLQQELDTIRQKKGPTPTRRHVEAKTRLSCVPSEKGGL